MRAPLIQVLLERAPNVDYDIDHWQGSIFMCKRTSATPNSEIFIASLCDPSKQRLLLAHRPDAKIEETSLSDGFYVILERSAQLGLQEIRIFALPESKDQAEV